MVWEKIKKTMFTFLLNITSTKPNTFVIWFHPIPSSDRMVKNEKHAKNKKKYMVGLPFISYVWQHTKKNINWNNGKMDWSGFYYKFSCVRGQPNDQTWSIDIFSPASIQSWRQLLEALQKSWKKVWNPSQSQHHFIGAKLFSK